MVDRVGYTGILRYTLIIKIDLAFCIKSNVLKKSVALDRIVDIRLRFFIKINNLRIASAFEVEDTLKLMAFLPVLDIF